MKFGEEKPNLSELFPECEIISCWCDAQAQVHLDELKDLLGPGKAIQPKGLLSTEGVVSFPIDDGDPVLAYNGHFYEFKNQETPAIKRAHELQQGRYYEVILTTQAGLYRYNSRDVVQVTGFWKGVPRLRFCGRSNLLGDFVGEKLSVQQALAVFEFLQKEALQPYAFTWKNNGVQGGYTILAGGSASDSVAEKANALLCENPYFAQAQKLKQMDVVRIEKTSAEAMNEVFGRIRKSKNITEGDFKNPLFVDYKLLQG
ncbi:MAG: GH3 auxin-responsive promoter family protein [Owenweeksia sp.]|nr:GH3 auxin-responsive promoter family protein [Owenweeksia sp.]